MRLLTVACDVTQRTKQEQVFRQSLLDLDKQKNELERERLALISQVNLLAQEVRCSLVTRRTHPTDSRLNFRQVRLEKRLSIAQLIGLLAIVLFVGFTRGSPTSPFLHLASAQAMRAAAKEESKRKEAARREGDLPESASEGAFGAVLITDVEQSADSAHLDTGPRRDPAYRSNSLTIARLPSKRLSSSLAPKPAPRRHYGNGNSGASSSKAPLRSPRTWTPPPRHASAPPEDPFASSLTSALESGGGTARRRSSKQPKYSHSPAPATNGRGGESVVGLAIHTSSGSSPYLNTPTIPPRASSSNSHRHAFRPSYVTRPSTLDDADTEPSEVGGDPEEYSASDVPSRGAFGRLGRNGLPSGDTDGGYRTYSASEEEEEDESRPPSPPPGRRDGASPFLKPPRPAVKKRPLSSPGPWGREERIPFPRQSDAPSQQQQQQQRLPTPEANLPSPPPEPEPQLQRDRQGEEEKGKGKEHAL